MSIFSEIILPKFKEISLGVNKLENDLKETLEKFEETYEAGRKQGIEKALKDKLGKSTLQCINEDDGEPKKISGADSNTSDSSTVRSKKRSKNEAEDILSPEVDKRLKRNASVKAQTIISKQVNVNLSAKLRRENSTDMISASDKSDKNTSHTSKGRKRKEDKENEQPNIVPAIQIKEEKISLPPEPMDTESLIIEAAVKQEVNKDDIAMPPPSMPVPKPRKAVVKAAAEAPAPADGEARRSRARNKQDAAPPPPVAGARATRASSRAERLTRASAAPEEAPAPPEEAPAPPKEARPKRTRAKKKASVSEAQTSEVRSTQSSQEAVSVSGGASPADKPRPKRTRRGKAAQKQEPPPPAEAPEPALSPKEEPTSVPSSPILQKDVKSKKKDLTAELTAISLHSTVDCSKAADGDMDRTRVISHQAEHHGAQSTPEKPSNMNETVVLEKVSDQTVVLDKPVIMDATVVIQTGPAGAVSDDDSLLTDDDSAPFHTPPHAPPPPPPHPLHSSAVKEKVQQFEELASRVTRTKTRARAHQEHQEHREQAADDTPPERAPVLSADTLSKMNSLIFNGKPHAQISSSACKPRAIPQPVRAASASASKAASAARLREAAEDCAPSARDEDAARRKKEALLDAKKELQRRKREEKMAAAAAARSNAERERRAALELAARERREKQAHLDLGRLEKKREQDRRKAELARKALETEERRRAEEAARLAKLADEQRRALQLRKKQQEEQEAMKKEAAIMAKEIEKRQKEYLEKQRMKSKLEDKMSTPLKTRTLPGDGGHMSPVYMQDGFQYLNSDEDEEPPPRPVPDWSTSKARKLQLDIQSLLGSVHVDRLFSVRVHSPDLSAIFPGLERARLKRTSSAVWRTPPH